MRQYASWQAPFYSFWSKSFYVDVAKNWHGLAYLYLFFLICFTWLFMSIKRQIDISYYSDRMIKPLIQQMPTVTINKGILSIDRQSPQTIKDNFGEPAVTFDTREKPMMASEAPGRILVTRKTVIFKIPDPDAVSSEDNKSESTKHEFREQELDISTIDHALIDQKSASQLLTDLKRSIGLIIFMVAVPFGYIICIIQSLLYGLIAMAIARLSKVEMSYGTMVRLSVVALTPVLLIDSLLKVRNVNTPAWGILAFIITVAYIIFAIRANVANQETKSEPSDS